MASFLALLIGVEPAWAYLDPGTGSLILQSLIAGVAGAFVVCRLYWAKFKTFVATAFSRRAAQPGVIRTVVDAREDSETELP